MKYRKKPVVIDAYQTDKPIKKILKVQQKDL